MPMRPAIKAPTLTAGFRFAPEIAPKPYATATMARPKASDTPIMPICEPISTAEPQPNSTRISVPNASAINFFNI